MVFEKILGLHEGFHEVAGGLGHLYRCIGSMVGALAEWEDIGHLCLVVDSRGHL